MADNNKGQGSGTPRTGSALLRKTDGKAPAKKGLGSALGTGRKSKPAFAGAARIRSVSQETIDDLKDRNPRLDRGYLGYIIDAKASRSHTWNLAKSIQKDMFEGVSKVGNLSARVVAFRNGGQGPAEIIDLGWHSESQPIIDRMDEVECRAGHTQIFNAVQKMVEGQQEFLPTNIVMIGDMCEEDDIILTPAIQMLQQRGIRAFTFHEGPDLNNPAETRNIEQHWLQSYKRGEQVYRNFAKHTGGAFAKFGPQMPLEDLCEAVGIYTVGQPRDFEQLMERSKAARLIGKQVMQIEDQRGHGPKGPKK